MEAQNDILDVIIDLTKQGYQVKFKPGWCGPSTFQIELYRDGHHVARTIEDLELRLTKAPKAETIMYAIKRLLWEHDAYVKNFEKEHADI